MYRNSDGLTTIEHYEEDEIKKLLLYRKIEKVEKLDEMHGIMVLDNGVELEIESNEGCGGCNSGWYYITELNNCDNVITDVEFVCTDQEDDPDSHLYQIFVFAEDTKIKIVEVDGDDGNGYYGTGYSITVKPIKK